MGAITVRRTGAKDYGRFIKMLIGGAPGAGKTLISSTARNPFYASAEGGLMSIADKNLPYMEIDSSDELFALKLMLDQDADVREKTFGFPIDTIVLDTIDEVQRILTKERLAETKKDALTLQDFGWMKDQMTSIIRGFRNLDMNVIFLVHLKDTSDAETGKTFVKPGLVGAVSDEISAYVDMALLLKSGLQTTVVDNAPQRTLYRVLQTMPDHMHDWIKDRSGKLAPEIPVNFIDDFERIYDTVFGNLELEDNEAVTLGGEEVFSEAVREEAEREAPPRPETVPVPEDQQKEPEQNPDLPNCYECGKQVENMDIADLSRIRFRQTYCKSCFTEKKTKK